MNFLFPKALFLIFKLRKRYYAIKIFFRGVIRKLTDDKYYN